MHVDIQILFFPSLIWVVYFTGDCRVPANGANFFALGVLLVCEGLMKLQTFGNLRQAVSSFAFYARNLTVISEHVHNVFLLKGMQEPTKQQTPLVSLRLIAHKEPCKQTNKCHRKHFLLSSFHLGVTESQNVFRFSELRMLSMSSSLNSLGWYWANIFLWNFL